MTNANPLTDQQLASAVFFPRPDMPFGHEASGVIDHMFEVEEGVRLRLRFFPGKMEAPNILFFHGNGETARDYDMLADEYRALPASLAVAEYRGYGPSTGKPSIHSFLTDAHRTLDEFKALLEKEGRRGPIVVMGRSLGSGPAIELAANRTKELAGLIIESGFARVVPLLELIGIPAGDLGITEDHGPRNQEKMGTVSLPTLILHAEDDEIIPIADAELLHAANKDPSKVFFRVPRAGHNDIQMRAGDAYFKHIRDLLARI
ncbi:MAG: alpha/beta hydrolase [Proteobacteria bacterium]|nr:alpha/beta hydrolase [Pseudomonadota bacterium]